MFFQIWVCHNILKSKTAVITRDTVYHGQLTYIKNSDNRHHYFFGYASNKLVWGKKNNRSNKKKKFSPPKEVLISINAT